MNINLNEKTTIDLATLIDTRLLVQANSGGGKSWLIRRILEQSHGKVQQIVIDLEGEFSTLREKFDYVVAGKGGDTPADPNSAKLLAKKLLELNVSAIIDLYELHHQDRKRFVRLFLEAMINAPKELWHPCIVVIDEAHVFCPEKGQSEASEAVIDLATRGRKRGFCAILATQRLSKLHKDAAAECNNKLIGRTGLDVDMKRASEELGFSNKEQYLSLRSLESGEFFAFGPAISREVVKTTVGPVQTTHPKAGSRISVAPPLPTTSKIRAVLAKLEDLPKEAKEEQDNLNRLFNENLDLKRKLLGRPPVQIINDPAKIEQAVKEAVAEKDLQIEELHNAMMTIGRVTSKYSNPPRLVIVAEPEEPLELEPGRVVHVSNSEMVSFSVPKPITRGAYRMLQVLHSRYPMTFTKSQLALLSKLSPRSGTYGTYLSSLRSNGFIVMEGDQIKISQQGMAHMGEIKSRPQTTEETLAMWRDNLSGGARRMFEVLTESYPSPISKEELGERTELSPKSGTFGTYLSMLKGNGLVEVNGSTVKASSNLFV
jgi:hypothetical protein